MDKGLIDGYPSKLEEDDARLKDKDLLPPFSNARHAVVQVCEKYYWHMLL